MEERDVQIVDKKKGVEINGIKYVSMGIEKMKILKGKMRVEKIEVEGVEFDLKEERGGGLWK